MDENEREYHRIESTMKAKHKFLRRFWIPLDKEGKAEKTDGGQHNGPKVLHYCKA